MIETIKENLKKLKKLESATRAAELKYEKFYDDKDAEHAFDEAYEKEFEMFLLVASQIALYANISEKTSRTMLREKREVVQSIFK